MQKCLLQEAELKKGILDPVGPSKAYPRNLHAPASFRPSTIQNKNRWETFYTEFVTAETQTVVKGRTPDTSRAHSGNC